MATFNLDPAAFALQPVRADVKNDRFIYYEATTFPRDPWNGCSMYIRRALLFAGEGPAYAVLDILDKDGSIIQDMPLTRAGFQYLRRVLKFKRERD